MNSFWFQKFTENYRSNILNNVLILYFTTISAYSVICPAEGGYLCTKVCRREGQEDNFG